VSVGGKRVWASGAERIQQERKKGIGLRRLGVLSLPKRGRRRGHIDEGKRCWQTQAPTSAMVKGQGRGRVKTRKGTGASRVVESEKGRGGGQIKEGGGRFGGLF